MQVCQAKDSHNTVVFVSWPFEILDPHHVLLHWRIKFCCQTLGLFELLHVFKKLSQHTEVPSCSCHDLKNSVLLTSLQVDQFLKVLLESFSHDLIESFRSNRDSQHLRFIFFIDIWVVLATLNVIRHNPVFIFILKSDWFGLPCVISHVAHVLIFLCRYFTNLLSLFDNRNTLSQSCSTSYDL